MKIREFFKKVFTWKIPTGVWAVIAVLFLIFALVPLYILSKYAIPFYDDYLYGCTSKHMMTSDFDVINAIRGAVDYTRFEWLRFQGTFASDFFMCLMPLIWADGQYLFVGPVILITMLVAGIFILTGVVLKDIFNADWKPAIIFQSVFTAMVIILLVSPQQGFYWYIGGMHYIGMHSFLMVLLAYLIHIKYSKTRGSKIFLAIVSVLLSVIAGGANFVTALLGVEITTLLLFWRIIRKDKTYIWQLPAYMVHLAAFFLNVLAPGNAGRAVLYEGAGYSAPMAVVKSFECSISFFKEFTGWATFVVMIMLVPVIWQIVRNSNREYKFGTLVLVSVIAYCLYASTYAPNMYATGELVLSRVMNAIQITLKFVLFICEFYGLGWIYSLSKKKGWKLAGVSGKSAWWFAPLCIVASFFLFKISPNPEGTYSNYAAIRYMYLTDMAETFKGEYEKRVELLEAPNTTEVVLEPYTVRPWLLIWSDITEDPAAEPNWAMTRWYGKEVRLKSEE